jgi:uncharacterized protein YukE
MAMQLVAMPETTGFLRDANRASLAAEQAGKLAAQLPALLTQERTAAVDQFAKIVDAREGQLRSLLAEMRSTLEAGAVTADALKAAVASFDQMMTRFDTPPGGAPSNSRPFNITEYTASARAFGETAQQLEALLNQIDANSPRLASVSDEASHRAEVLVDHLFWRLVQLVLIIVASALAGALICRWIIRRTATSPRPET